MNSYSSGIDRDRVGAGAIRVHCIGAAFRLRGSAAAHRSEPRGRHVPASVEGNRIDTGERQGRCVRAGDNDSRVLVREGAVQTANRASYIVGRLAGRRNAKSECDRHDCESLCESTVSHIGLLFVNEFLGKEPLPPSSLPSLGQAETGGRSGQKCVIFFVLVHDPAEITTLLKAWGRGDQEALDRLADRVYGELRAMARRHMKNERPDNTLQTTALVHEVYIRLVDTSQIEWHERAQFFAMAARMMRRVLVDAARARRSHKRGGLALRVNLDETAVLSPSPDRSILALDEALAEFSQVAPRQAKVVELRYFGGLTEEEIVAVLNVSPRTVRRDWDLARAWLLRELKH